MPRDEQHDYLLDAIDSLTKGTRQRLVLPVPFAMQVVEHEPLLARLRASIMGSTGSHAGGNDPAGRLPFDPVAMSLYDRIEAEISSWFVELRNEPVYLYPEETLRQWFITFSVFRRADDLGEMEIEATRKVSSWVRQINDMFDPPVRLEVTKKVEVPVVNTKTGERLIRRDGTPRTRMSTRPASCPWCEQATAFDPRTGDQISALVITYRQSEQEEALTKAIGVCRSCERVWPGATGIKAMRKQIARVELGLPPVDPFEPLFTTETEMPEV